MVSKHLLIYARLIIFLLLFIKNPIKDSLKVILKISKKMLMSDVRMIECYNEYVKD